jgi:hypothetical protein
MTATIAPRDVGRVVFHAAQRAHVRRCGAMTSYVNSEGIQSGWTVWSSDGQELGTVIGTDQTMIRIKKGGLLSKELLVPRTAVEEVETGRVELNMTKSEVESQAH